MFASTRLGRSLLVAAAASLTAGTAQASLIWDGDPSGGLAVFGNMNCDSPGSVTAAADPTQGTVWRYNKPSGSNRCENHGIKVNGSRYVFRENTTYYLGWRSRLTSVANNNANFQWKSYGSHIQNYPVLLKMIGGKMNLMYRHPGESCCRTLWSRTVSTGVWNDYTLGLHLSSNASNGWIEFWFDGAKQTLSNGATRYPGRTLDDINEPKWGIYGASGTPMANFVDALKVGTTYEDVAPGGGGTPTETPTPTITPTPTPTATPSPTPTPTVAPGPILEVTPGAGGVTASGHDGNVPANTVDNSLATRWSANGDGQWIQFDLGSILPIRSVAVATYKGDSRRGRFDIQVSTGGAWTTVLTGALTSGISTAEESFTFAPVQARLVRYVGHGNTDPTKGTWNSVTEVSIFRVP